VYGIPPHRRGAYASSRHARRASGGRDPLRETSAIGADDEIVWSWHPGADAKRCEDNRNATGAKKPVPEEITYKSSTHRAGKVGMSRLNLWFLPRAFYSHGGHGCGQHPTFPALSAVERVTE
jgi:hypothetical protein